MNKNAPEKKFVAGPIAATIWKNSSMKDGKEFFFETVSLERSFKDKNGEWKSTSNMRVNDLPKAAMVMNKAYEYLTMKE